MKILRVKGARRTGNNFLIEALRANLDVKVDTGGGAHKVIRKPKVNHVVHFIITIKNPYSWCLSITNWAKSSWSSDWQKATWKKNWDKWEKLYKGYNRFYKVNLRFCDEYEYKSFVIKYEDFLQNPRKKLDLISESCDINFKTNKLVIPKKVPQSSKFSKSRRKFYLDSDGTFGLNDKMIRKINKCVDWELMSLYGYERINK
jgi:hypothetical protein